MLSNISLPSLIAQTIMEKLLSNNIRSEDSLATSVPEPRAIPISACFRAGASFTPSPVIATTFPSSWKALTICNLCLGSTRA